MKLRKRKKDDSLVLPWPRNQAEMFNEGKGREERAPSLEDDHLWGDGSHRFPFRYVTMRHSGCHDLKA